MVVMLSYFGKKDRRSFLPLLVLEYVEIVGNILSTRRAGGPENDFAHALSVVSSAAFETGRLMTAETCIKYR